MCETELSFSETNKGKRTASINPILENADELHAKLQWCNYNEFERVRAWKMHDDDDYEQESKEKGTA